MADCRRYYAISWLTSLTIRSKTTAPMAAARMAPTMPPPSVRPIPSDHGTHDADDNIAKQAEAGALHQQAGEPACDGANNQGYDQSCHDFSPHKI